MVDRPGGLPYNLGVEAKDGTELLTAATSQLDEGADLVKLYLDGPERDTAPFTADEVRAVVAAVHARGGRVAAHATQLAGARVAAQAAVDSIEHGSVLDRQTAALMAANGVTLVSTLAVFSSWQSFAATSTVERFVTAEHDAIMGGR